MRKIVEGLLYDTETAEQVCAISFGSLSDWQFELTGLYRTPKGVFFLAGEGGPLSRWGTAEVTSSGTHRSAGEGLRPVAIEEAKQLIEQYGSVGLYTELFGEPPEA